MYQVGDYVVFLPPDTGERVPGIWYIYSIDDDNCKLENVLTKKRYWFIKEIALRPAVLADWAKEIPEKYRQFDNKYWFIIKDIIEDSSTIYQTRDKSMESIRNGYGVQPFIADALSAHYGIPIMPYEQYKKYMEEK